MATARNAAAPWHDVDRDKRGDIMLDEDRFEDFAAAIAHWGYSWEPYRVVTRDGFELTLFRITGSPPEGFVKPELSSSSSESEH